MMKKPQSNFTTPEQSKLLLEFGVPADSADCIAFIISDPVWYNNEFAKGEIRISVLHPRHKYTKIAYPDDGSRPVDEPYPCWSVGRLMEIYSTCIKDDAGEYWPLHSSVESVGFTFIEHVINRFVIDDIDLSKLKDYGIAE